MAPYKILLALVLILVISSLSDASLRVLMADDQPNAEKEKGLATPAPILPQNLKEGNQNMQPGKKDEGMKVKEDTQNGNRNEAKKETNGPVKGGEDGKVGEEQKEVSDTSKKEEDGKKVEGQKEGNNPSKNEENGGKGSDPLKKEENDKKSNEQKGSNEPSGSEENGTKGDGKKGSSDPKKSEENGKKGEGAKESEDPSKNEENGKKGDGQKGSNDPTKNGKNGKEGEGKKGSSDPLKNGENGKKADEQKGDKDSSKNEKNGAKGDGQKESNDPSKNEGNGEKGDVHKGKEEPGREEDKIVMPQSCYAKCNAQDLVACLQRTVIGSQEFVVHVKNNGETSMTVDVTVPPTVEVDSGTLNISKHSIRKVKISAKDTKSRKIVLNSGKGDCQFQIGIDSSAGISPSINGWNPFYELSSTQMMPVYGAFLLFTIAIAGGVWGFCKFRRGRRAASGIPYQQLEMGAQVQSSTAIEASSVDGWDESWDDDWDDEEATRVSNTSLNNRNISSNGLSSRSANKKNDWDIDWDD